MNEIKEYTEKIFDSIKHIDENGKGLVNSNIGLITYDEMVHAGGRYGTKHNQYYLYNNTHYWSMSPTGTFTNMSFVWVMYTTGSIELTYPDYTNVTIRPVINLKADVTVTGTGTITNPYIVD